MFDESTILSVIQRNMTFYQKIGNIGFFVMQFFSNDLLTISKERTDDAFAFLEENIETNDDHIFIVSHLPMYSFYQSTVSEYVVSKMEAFLDSHQNSKIRAIISGHDHEFSGYLRNSVYFLSCAATGG